MSESINCCICKEEKKTKEFSVHEDKVKESVCACKEASVCDACFGKHLASGKKTCLSCGYRVLPKNYSSNKYVHYEDKSAMVPFLLRWLFYVFELLGSAWNATRCFVRKADMNPDIIRQLNADDVLKKVDE
jgi:hypothetical protein